MQIHRLGWMIAIGLAVPAVGLAQEPETVALLPRPALLALQNPVPDPNPVVVPASVRNPRTTTYRAALLSALVPGLGEYYTGHRTRALVSGTLEGAVWASYVTFKVQENLRDERAIEYAVAFAGARQGGDEDYYKAVGQYLRAEGPGQWNEFVRRRERDTGEIVGREYIGDDAWAWTSIDRFVDYRRLRKDTLTAGDRATNALAFALVNRIVSVVSVVQAVRADHARTERALGLRLDARPGPDAPEWRLGLAGRF